MARPKIRLLSASRLKTKRRCGRLHHFKYELGYEPRKQAEPLVLGTGAHGALEAWWNAWRVGIGDQALELALNALDDHVLAARMDAFQSARLHAMIDGYHARWAPEMASGEYEVLAVEVEFVAPLVDPVSGQLVRAWVAGGKIDVMLRHIASDRTLGMEHKSSSEDVAVGSTYWKRLRMEGQISFYFDGAAAMDMPVGGFLYDVLRKPDQKPHKATPEAERKFTQEKSKKCPTCKSGGVLGTGATCADCGGQGKIITEPARLYSNQRETDETPEDYFKRCRAAIAEAPEKFYLREEISRLPHELDEARAEAAEFARQIDDHEARGMKMRNTDACFDFNRECAFWAVCTGAASLQDGALYRLKQNVHSELSFKEPPSAAIDGEENPL